ALLHQLGVDQAGEGRRLRDAEQGTRVEQTHTRPAASSRRFALSRNTLRKGSEIRLSLAAAFQKTSACLQASSQMARSPGSGKGGCHTFAGSSPPGSGA